SAVFLQNATFTLAAGKRPPKPGLTQPSRCELLLVQIAFRSFEKNSQMVRRDFSGAVQRRSRWSMVEGSPRSTVRTRRAPRAELGWTAQGTSRLYSRGAGASAGPAGLRRGLDRLSAKCCSGPNIL